LGGAALQRCVTPHSKDGFRRCGALKTQGPAPAL